MLRIANQAAAGRWSAKYKDWAMKIQLMFEVIHYYLEWVQLVAKSTVAEFGICLPFTGEIGPITLVWNKLNVYARPQKPKQQKKKKKNTRVAETVHGKGKQILINVTGIAKPGQLIAVMGAR